MTTPPPDDESPGDESVQYLVYDNGTVAKQVYEPPDVPPVPDGARVVTADEYQQALAQVQAQQQEHDDDVAAQEEAQRKANYDALVAAGIPDAVARSLSGYTGEES